MQLAGIRSPEIDSALLCEDLCGLCVEIGCVGGSFVQSLTQRAQRFSRRNAEEMPRRHLLLIRSSQHFKTPFLTLPDTASKRSATGAFFEASLLRRVAG